MASKGYQRFREITTLQFARFFQYGIRGRGAPSVPLPILSLILVLLAVGGHRKKSGKMSPDDFTKLIISLDSDYLFT